MIDLTSRESLDPESRLNEVEARLGCPAYRAPGVLIYHGDCLDLLPRLAPATVDLTVTSPPYNIGKEYESVRPIDDYLAWCDRWFAEIARATSSAGAFWLNVGYAPVPNKGKAVPLAYLLWDRVPLFLLQEVVWNYGAGVAARHSFSPRNEKLLWYVKDSEDYVFNLDAVRDPNVKYPHQKKNGKLRCNPAGKNPSDVWAIAKVTSGTNRSSAERTSHPAQYPVEMIERIIKACSNAGDLVVDPFLGSGTTAEVALGLGRPFVGFEIDSKYVDIAIRRIESSARFFANEKLQATLL